MKAKFLVIGSNSFSGSHFIDHCINKNHQVIGISRSKEKKNFFLRYKSNKKLKSNFKFYKLDINNDMSKIKKMIKFYKPTHIVNFASQSMVAQSWEMPLDWYRTNVISSVKLIQSIKSMKFLKRYVHISTPEVYGNTPKNLRENTSYNPTTPYAISRASFDMHLMQEAINFDLPVVFTRAANVYGPGQDLYRIIPRSIFSCFSKNTMKLDGGGLSKRSFIYIDDVVRATYKVAIRGKKQSIFHISTNQEISILNLVKKIFKFCNSDFKKKVIIGPERKGKDKIYSLNSSKIKKELRWKPKVSLNEGIKKTINWFELNKKKLIKEKVTYQHKK